MIPPAIPTNEKQRLENLKYYSLLDTLEENEYDGITKLAAYICQTPVSLVTLVEEKRVWFKSHFGLNERYAPRELTFCAHSILDKTKVMIVPDSLEDERFSDNPFVTGKAGIRFYAGLPLVSSEGFALGTLCVLDNKPRELKTEQIEALRLLANTIIRLFDCRRTARLLNSRMHELELHNKALGEFARVAAHDIKSPLNNIIQLSGLISSDKRLNNKTGEIIEMITLSAEKLSKMIDGILKYSKDSRVHSNCKRDIQVFKLVKELEMMLNHQPDTEFIIDISEKVSIFANKVALEQILINLISNAIKFNDKPQKIVRISAVEKEQTIQIIVRDNGSGIQEENKESIFRLFKTTAKNHTEGLGIGLATVKSLVETLGGTITVHSVKGSGSEFEIIIPK